MEIKNGGTYQHNYARAAAFFLGTCAPKPIQKEQVVAYEFITGIYEAFANEIESLGLKSVPDEPFAPWEQQKGREKDTKNIRGAIAKIGGIILEIFDIVEKAEILTEDTSLIKVEKISRLLTKILDVNQVKIQKQENGIQLQTQSGCMKELKKLAKISREHTIPITDGPQEDKAYLYFSRCVFDPSTNWTAVVFDQLLDAKGQLIWLCEQLEQRGYKRVDCYDGKKVSLDYVKQYGKKEEPLKIAWAERTHSGISLSYEELRLEPAFFWIRMPMFKTVLASEQHLPENVVAFIDQCTKNCDGCKYCVQTDKTKTKPLANISFHGKKKCPHFVGFTMNWRSLTPELAQNTLVTLNALNNLDEFK